MIGKKAVLGLLIPLGLVACDEAPRSFKFERGDRQMLWVQRVEGERCEFTVEMGQSLYRATLQNCDDLRPKP